MVFIVERDGGGVSGLGSARAVASNDLLIAEKVCKKCIKKEEKEEKEERERDSGRNDRRERGGTQRRRTANVHQRPISGSFIHSLGYNNKIKRGGV